MYNHFTIGLYKIHLTLTSISFNSYIYSFVKVKKKFNQNKRKQVMLLSEQHNETLHLFSKTHKGLIIKIT